jgi:hypothetical protein
VWNAKYNTDDRRTAMVARAATRKAAGVCANCSKPARPGRIHCPGCASQVSRPHHQFQVKLKVAAVAYLGGMCVDCETRFEILAVYDFHHVDPAVKAALINKMIRSRKPWELIRGELDKCVLLCANCHRIRHARGRAERPITTDADLSLQDRSRRD